MTMENPYPQTVPGVPISDDPFKGIDLSDLKKPAQLRQNYEMVSGQNPDEAAKIVDLSKRFNESPNFIANNLDKATQAANAPDFEAIAKTYPYLSEFLVDPKRMAMAHDDIENLGHVEAAIQANSMLLAFGAGYQGSVTGLAYRKALPEVEVPENAPFRHKLAAAAGGLAGDLPAMWIGGVAGAIPGIAGGPAAAVTGMAGAFALPAAIKQTLIEHYRNGDIDTSEELFRRIYSISKETIKSGAIGVATFGGAKLAGKALEGVAGAVAPKGIPFVIKPGAMTAARTTGELAGMTVGGAAIEGKKPTFEDAAINTMLIGALHSTGVIKGKIYDMRYEAMKAAQSKVTVEELAKATAALKTLNRAPSEVAEFIDGQIGPALIPVEKFETLFQSKDIDPEKMAINLGIGDSYKDAKASGGNVSIPMGTLQSKAMDKYRPGLVNDVKFHEDSFTVNEINERRAEYDEAVKTAVAESDKAIKENPDLQAAHDLIAEDVKARLSKAVAKSEGEGVKASVDEAAKITASTFIAQGVRRGIDPLEFYRQKSLGITGKIGPGDAELMQGKEPYKWETINKPFAGSYASDTSEKPDFIIWKIQGGPRVGKFTVNKTGIVYKNWDTVAPKHKENMQSDGEFGTLEEAKQYAETLKSNILRYAKGQEGKLILKKYPKTGSYYADTDSGQIRVSDHYARTKGEQIGEGLHDFIRGGDTPDYVDDKIGGIEFKRTEDWSDFVFPEKSNALAKFRKIEKEVLVKREEYIKQNPELFQTPSESFYQSAWHGSPHDFDKFSLHKIGTGEGAQAYGWGLYFAGDKSIAEYYRKALSKNDILTVRDEGGKILAQGEALSSNDLESIKWLEKGARDAGEFKHNTARYAEIAYRDSLTGKPNKAVLSKIKEWADAKITYEKTTGKLYEVQIPEDDKLLDWDKPLSEQSEYIKKALEKEQELYRKTEGNHGIYVSKNSTGRDIYIESKLTAAGSKSSSNSSELASKYLNNIGIKGLKYLDFGSRGAGEGSHNYVIFDDKAVDIINKHYQGKGQEPLASFSKTKQGAFINMFKAADASSFLHELSHFWLTDINEYVKSGSANEQYLADWKTIQDYLGIKEGKEISREQHEKFAQSFERYLMEGKAPSVELQGAFAKMKAWMIKIYDGVRRTLGVEAITPEIKGVFDRLVATDEAITEARSEIGMDVSETLAGLTGDALKARQQAEAILLKPMMEDLSAANKAKLEAERKRITAEAEVSISQEPLYEAIDSLRKAIGIEKDTFTEQPVRNDAQKFIDGTLDAKKSELFEIQAEVNGFSSGDELAKKILEADTMESAIQKIVDTEMGKLDRLTDKAAIKEDALKALHSGDNMGKLLSLEMQVLEGMRLNKDINAELSKERRANASREWEAIKMQASKTLGNKPIAEAGKFRTYYTLERKAAERVAKAMAKGDTEAAIKAKREQIVSHALAAEAIRLKERIGKDIAFLDDQRKADKKLFKKDEHFQQVASLLSRFGMGRNDFDPSKKQETLTQWATRIADIYGEAVSAFPDWIMNEAITKDLKSLTANELKDLRDSVAHIKHIANGENQMLLGERRAMIDALAGELHSAQIESGNVGKTATTSAAESWPDKIIAAKDWVRNELITVETLLRKLDSYKHEGIWWKSLFEGYKNSADNRAKDMVETAAKYRDIWDAYTPKEREGMDSKKIFVPELGVSLTKTEIMTAAMNWGTETNRQRLLEGSGRYKDSDGKQWTPEAVTAMFDREMTKRDWDTVQKTWDLVDSFWSRIAAMYERITGFAPERLERSTVQTPHGEYFGGYFPLRRDTRLDIRGDEQMRAEQMLGQMPTWRASTKNGFTKSRVIGAEYPVSLDIRGINRHLSDVIHDLNLREWVLDSNRLLNNKEIQVSLQDALGMEGFKTVKDWARDIAGTKGYESFDPILREIRRRTIISTLGLRLSTVFLQADDLSAYGRVDPKNFGVINVMSSVASHYAKVMFRSESIKEVSDFVDSKSKYMKYERGENLDRDVTDAAKNSFGKDDKIAKAAMFFVSTADKLLSKPVWKEAYKVGLELNKGNDDKAISYADGIIRRAQASGRLGEMAKIMRGSEFKKALTMFYSFMSKRANIWYEQIDKTKTPADAAELAGTFMALWIFPSLFSSFIRNGLPSDEKKQKKYLKEILMYPFTLFPVIRDIADFAMDKALGLPDFGYGVTPLTRSVDLLGNFIGKMKSDTATKGQKAEAVARLSSLAVPYPDQLNVWVFNAADYANGMTPKPEDVLRRRPVKER